LEASQGIWAWSRAGLERDLEREIQNHLAYEAQESGDGRALGNIALVKEESRSVGMGTAEQFARDIHFGWRQVRRNPSFSAIAIGTLALGIGGVAAVFSAVDAVLIRPLPYAGEERLVTLWDDLSMSRTREPEDHFDTVRVDPVAAAQYRVYRSGAHNNRARPRLPARAMRKFSCMALDQNQLCGMIRTSPGFISTFAETSPRLSRSLMRTLYCLFPSAVRRIEAALPSAKSVTPPDRDHHVEQRHLLLVREDLGFCGLATTRICSL